MVAGEDPYAWKGLENLSNARVRIAGAQNAAPMKGAGAATM